MSQDETAVNETVEMQETTQTDSAPVENKAPEVADPLLAELSSDDDSPVVQSEEEPEAEVPTEDTPEETAEEEPEEQPLGKADERKQQLNSEIRDLVSQRNALRAEIEKVNEVYKPQTAEELIEQGYSESEARVAALEQKLELSEYNNKVAEAQMSLSEESRQVLDEFPIFNPDSPEFDQDVASSAAELLSNSLIKDPNTGQIIGSQLTPYQIYKPIADAYRKSRVEGQIKGQKATAQRLSAVDATPSATPKEPKKDPLLEILTSDD